MEKEIKNEDQLQALVYQTIHNKYPQLRYKIFHVPCGGTRHKIEAIKMHAMGVTAGIPDLLIVHKAKLHGIELKFEDGALSAEQKKIHKIWKEDGINVHVIRSLEEALEVVEGILGERQ